MKLTCARRDLHEAVQTVGRAASTQTALPILNHILLTMEGGRLFLTATDQELSARTSIPVQGSLQESIAVPARALGEIVSSLPDGAVEMDTSARHQISISRDQIRFNLKGLPAEGFPSIPVVHVPGDNASRMSLDQRSMKRLIRQTLFAVSSDPTRIQYTGILFEREDRTLRLVSTDGVVRVAVSSAPLESEGSAIGAIVPSRAVQELNRTVKPDVEDPVTLYFRSDFSGPTLASFEANGVTLVTRLIEGQFAPWRRVVPSEWTERVTLKSAETLGALKRMAIVAHDDQERVQLAVSDEGLQLSCASPSLGDAQERLPALVEGEEILIALHGRFLADGIDALGEEGCRLEFTRSLSPCVVRPLEGESYLYVQSPMLPR